MRANLVVLILGSIVLGSFAQRRPPNYSQDDMPLTTFSCSDKIIGGYYADPETDCQMFHVCAKVAGGVQDFRFLCPNDTSFDQENQICDDWYNIDCESHLLYNDNFDLYRLGVESNRPIKPIKATPIPLGPTSAKPIVPSFNRQKPFVQGSNSIDEEENFLRSDSGDRRLSNDLLRGSSSSNFYSNRNGKDEYLDNDSAHSIKQQDLNKGSKEFEKKKNKAVVRKLLTGKRPIANSPNTVSNEPNVEYSTKYPGFYRNKQTTSYTQTSTAVTQTPSATAAPTESTTLYVRPKNSNLRFRGNVNYNTQNTASDTVTPAVTQPSVEYYKKTTSKTSYNKNVYNANQQQNYNANEQQANQQQAYNANQQQNYNANQQAYNTNQQQANYNTNQQQTYNANQQQAYNANQQQNYNTNTQTQASFNTNQHQQVYNANPQAAQTYSANQQIYNTNQQYNANQQNLINGINQQAYNVNNLQSSTTNNQNDFTQQQQAYTASNNQQYNNGPTQVPLDYFKKTSSKQSVYKQSSASQTYNTPANTQSAQKETTQNYNEFYRTSTIAPTTNFNYNEYYRTSTNAPSTTFNYNEYYKTSPNAQNTQFDYNEYYRTSTVAANNNLIDFYKTSTNSPSSTFDYNEYYRTSASNLPSSTANYYDPYNSYKEKFLANSAYEEDVQDEFLKTAPSSNLKPSDINAFSKNYVKPVSFNASLTAKLSYNTKAETTLKPVTLKTASPTQQTYYSAKQNTQTSITQAVPQQAPVSNQQKPAENKKEVSAAPQTVQPQAPKQQSVPTLSLEEYKKILEKPSDYDYAYYDGGASQLDKEYDGIERIPEEFSKTKNIKKA